MTTDTELAEAVANCDRDPIHIPGSILAFGALIATDSKLARIEFASETTDQYLGITARNLLGQAPDHVLDEPLMHSARNALTRSSATRQREVIGEKVFGGTRFQISVHRSDERAVLEFLPYVAGARSESDVVERARVLFSESTGSQSVEVILNSAVESLRASTRFDRVKAYRFLPDGSGEVVAESRASHMESYLGLRFPATDIPPIARQLYMTTPIRILPNIHAADRPLLSLDPKAQPLDLSLSILRGSAGIHIQYLKNMGVKSTMTLPIIVDGAMWGLFALHNSKPVTVEPTMLIAGELTGKMLGLVLQQASQTRHLRRLNECLSFARRLLSEDATVPLLEVIDATRRAQLGQLIPADGIALVAGEEVNTDGTVPGADVCRKILTQAFSSEHDLLLIDDLQSRYPEPDLGDCGGALCIPISAERHVGLIVFRLLATHRVKWAGKPEKLVTRNEQGLQLNPRHSFERYHESVQGKCDEWTNDEFEMAQGMQDALMRVFSMQTEVKESRDRSLLLVRELNHRVRNILTLVQSLSRSSKASASSLEEYAVALEERISALASAHNLLTSDDMRGARLDKIARIEFRPFLESSSNNTELSGPEILLKPDASPIMALVLHELTSNSVKYGSLSVPEGRVSLSWSQSHTGLEIDWREAGGPVVQAPERAGFGRSIIENAIPHELGGEARIDFLPTGVQAWFRLPAHEFEVTSIEVAPGQTDVETASTPVNRDSRSVLILEDNFVIATEVQRWFSTLGFDQIELASSVPEALEKLTIRSFDFGFLDVNIRGVMSGPVADRLSELGTPFVFSSGYGSAAVDICQSFDAILLIKPSSIDEVRSALQRIGFLTT